MKRVILLGVVLLGIATSCTKEVCVSCIDLEHKYQSQYYCGTPKDAKEFEKDLKDNGLIVGYQWVGGERVEVIAKEWACNKQKFK